ncbi:MAG: mycothione reductase [Terracoccus sp.]
MTEHFDLAIIGTGSGNSLVTPEFDDKRVAIIESGVFGGTCLNVGCIPTKMFVYAAEVADTIRGAGRFGVDGRVDAVRWQDIRDRVFTRIDPIAEGGKNWRIVGPNTTALLGRARFTGERELTVDLHDGTTATLTADQVVVATGAHPHVPDLVRDSGVAFHTSDTVMRIEALPERMAIVGGGYIAVEMAHVFSSLGVQVTVLVRGPQLLRQLDDDLSRRFTAIARGRWDVRTGVELHGLEPLGTDGGARLDLGADGSLETDLLLVATGRTPNSTDLGLELAGVRCQPDGRVAVDDFGRTTADGVWSLGDVSSTHQLKHVANAEARAVAHNLVHPEDLRGFPHDHVPSGIFSHPQVASVGLTEQECLARGLRHVTKIQSYGDTAYGWAMEDTTSVCKVIADPATGLLLGAHLMGPHATTLIQPLIQAMAFGTPAQLVARGQYWIHPALAEVVENALLGLELDTDED